MKSVDFFFLSFSDTEKYYRATANCENSPNPGLFFFVQRRRITGKNDM